MGGKGRERRGMPKYANRPVRVVRVRNSPLVQWPIRYEAVLRS